jgi:hypothetical protein
VKTVLFAATTVTEISFATGRTGRHYLCAGEDDQSGEYVRADVAEGLLAACKEFVAWDVMEHPRQDDPALLEKISRKIRAAVEKAEGGGA